MRPCRGRDGKFSVAEQDKAPVRRLKLQGVQGVFAREAANGLSVALPDGDDSVALADRRSWIPQFARDLGKMACRPIPLRSGIPPSTTYIGAIETAELFGPHLYAEAWERGGDPAKKKAVLGDGAEWIWNIAKQHFAGALQIVDIWHAREHL